MEEIILGLDPGTLKAGFGVIRVRGDQLEALDHGVIRLKEDWPLARRLVALNEALERIHAQYKFSAAAVEKIFFGKNVDSAFKLGHARGVCLLVSARHEVPVAEYAARFVKKCVAGSGAASKESVQVMVMQILRLPPQHMAFDATDALSLAITHARQVGLKERIHHMMEGST